MNEKLKKVVGQMAIAYNDPEHLGNILLLKGYINDYLEDFTREEILQAISDYMGEIASEGLMNPE